jgi:nitrate/TMAO reductase-like tetraheme cytochrome c subunit
MYRSKGPRRYWPRSRAGGCLLWIVLLIVILIVLSLLFGGFQKGTKANSLAPVCTSCTSAPAPGEAFS